MSAPPGLSAGPATGPLAGLRVLDLTINILGPVAAQILGDLGADVLKIETPDGDPMRGSGPARHAGMAQLFMKTNRNKRSVVLDLKQPRAREALGRLISTCDVFLHSLRPAAAARLGIDYAAVAQHNPTIVYACAPGYRSDGPHRDRPAFDDVIQGESGIAGLMAKAGGEPRYLPMIAADKLCGYVLASSIGMALLHRCRTGEGQQVEVPMLETMLAFNLTEHLWVDAFDGGGAPLGYARVLSPHRKPYATQDGYICLLAVNDEQWARLLRALDRPDLVTDPRFVTIAERSRHIDQLYAIVAREIARRTTGEWRKILDAADVPNGSMNRLEDLPHDPYLEHTGFFRRYRHPTEGTMVTSEIPVRFSRSPGQLRRPPPTLGEHTHEVLAELGYSAHEIEQLGAS